MAPDVDGEPVFLKLHFSLMEVSYPVLDQTLVYSFALVLVRELNSNAASGAATDFFEDVPSHSRARPAATGAVRDTVDYLNFESQCTAPFNNSRYDHARIDKRNAIGLRPFLLLKP